MSASPLNPLGYLIPRMGLSARIAEAIEKSGKSKADIARSCGVTGASVTFWISGDTKSLKAETAIALEQATGYRAAWLLNGSGPRKVGEATLIWPFSKVPVSRFLALPEDDRGYVQRRLLQAIEECERTTLSDDEQRRFDELTKPTRTSRRSVKKAA